MPAAPVLPPQTPEALEESRRYGLSTLAKMALPLVLGFCLADWIVGLVHAGKVGESDSNAFMHDEQLGYVSRPNYVGVWRTPEGEAPPPGDAVRHSSLGLRSEEIPADAPGEEVRVLAVGASLAYGAGRNVQETIWNYKLQDAFDQNEAKRGYPVRVLNGAVQGYSTYQAAKRGLLLLDAVQPDVVLLFTRPGRQSMAAPSDSTESVLVDGEWVPVDVVEGWSERTAWMPAALHKFLLAYSNIYVRYRTNQKTTGSGEELAPNFVVNRSPDWPVGTRERVDETLDEYRALIAECERRGIELYFLLNTEPEQQAQKRWEKFLEIRQISGAPAIGTPREEPSEVLRELVASTGGVIWDLWDLNMRFGEKPEYYTNIQRGDDHWNGEGHLAVAIELYKRLMADGLLDRLAERRAAAPRESEAAPE